MISSLLALLLLSGPAVEYRATFENAVHHEAVIEATFSELPSGDIRIKMSRSSPGRYALHGFSKNVYAVSAFDSDGRQLPVARTDSNEWTVTGHDGSVRFRYTLFADWADGTFSAVDTTHIHLNMPATFVWAAGLEDRPIRVQFAADWKTATQLSATGDPSIFTAPNLAYFLDSPTEISDHEVYEWQSGSGSNRQTIRLALHHAGTPEEGRAFFELVRAVVEEELGIFGELPAFNDKRYTFIACYLDHVDGDGMEHRNSTILTSTNPLKTGAMANLGTVAHEFFHAWNVERLRPKTLEPFDFEGPNVSGELWFAEGFTSYYDNLVLRRAGLISFDALLEKLESNLSDVILSPGHLYRGPTAMSREALFHDAASWTDPTNSQNTFISYYGYGAAIGLALDLTLRTEFPEHDLDGFMRAVGTEFGKPESPYDLPELEQILSSYTDDPSFASVFFRRYVLGSEMPPFRELLQAVGLDLQVRDADEAWLGDVDIEKSDEGVFLDSGTQRDQPAYQAGLDRGDQIIQLGERAINEPRDIEELLKEAKPGDSLVLRFKRRGQEIETTIRLQSNPALGIVRREQEGRLSPKQAELRNKWLAARSQYRIGTGKYCPICARNWPHEYETCPYDSGVLGITPPD